ncbi:MAG: T9SS type A sorting domain-containing protein [Ignavibacteria bacterium]|nr:T9SS type A sorting domain-containing protein [Ignavibacteria bacterium]MCC7158228.1 T9SS type A sorting domain-containing protein [Ignavibacteria bacterium]
MKILVFTFCFALCLISNIYSQQFKAELYDPPRPYSGNSDWGLDYLVSSTEPMGRPSGVYRTTNNTIYVVVPDTNIVSNKCAVALSSTNNGATWVIIGSVQPSAVVPKVKMVTRPGSDSVYCAMIIGTSVYVWNVITNNFNLFPNQTLLADFDMTMSSTQSIYLIVDLNANNQVRWFGSANGGTTWGNELYMSSAATRPKMYMSGLGDTALIIYYGPVVADTITGAVRFVRYRETAPGILTTIVGSFTTIIAAGTPKDQIEPVRNGTNSWIFYTSGLTGSIDLNCISSIDGGTTYGAPVIIGSVPGRDEYWFSARHYNSGVDIIYYSDSLQAGAPTSNSDRMYNCYALNSTPTAFSTSAQFNQQPLEWSSRGYIPTIIEYYDGGNDAGAIWVGIDGANKRLYFDRYGAITGISQNGNTIPNSFSLGQNYPNPFNPSTKIEFAIPHGGFVTLKIYDMLGREVESLLNENMKPGSYNYDFDASHLSSGVYFYRIDTEGFSDVKKMMLIK